MQIQSLLAAATPRMMLRPFAEPRGRVFIGKLTASIKAVGFVLVPSENADALHLRCSNSGPYEDTWYDLLGEARVIFETSEAYAEAQTHMVCVQAVRDCFELSVRFQNIEDCQWSPKLWQALLDAYVEALHCALEEYNRGS